MKYDIDKKLEQLAQGCILTIPASRYNLVTQMLEIAIIKNTRRDERDICEMKRMDPNFEVNHKPVQMHLPFVTKRRRRKTDG